MLGNPLTTSAKFEKKVAQIKKDQEAAHRKFLSHKQTRLEHQLRGADYPTVFTFIGHVEQEDIIETVKATQALQDQLQAKANILN